MSIFDIYKGLLNPHNHKNKLSILGIIWLSSLAEKILFTSILHRFKIYLFFSEAFFCGHFEKEIASKYDTRFDNFSKEHVYGSFSQLCCFTTSYLSLFIWVWNVKTFNWLKEKTSFGGHLWCICQTFTLSITCVKLKVIPLTIMNNNCSLIDYSNTKLFKIFAVN